MGKRKRIIEEDPLVGQTFFIDAEPEDEAPRGGIGSQVLPVLETGQNFESLPDDGETYLGMVRKQAAELLHTASVTRSYPTPPPSAAGTLNLPPEFQLGRPDEDWRIGFEAAFRYMRQRIRRTDVLAVSTDHSYLPIPEAQDADAWREYIYRTAAAGPANNRTATAAPHPDDPQSGSQQNDRHQPRMPCLELVGTLDQATVLQLIEHFDGWIRERLERAHSGPSTVFLPPSLRKKANVTSPSAAKTIVAPVFDSTDAQWIFSLLAVLDDLLVGDVLDRLRRIARTCLAVLAAGPGAIVDENARAGCWIVVAAVAGVWAQRDLWIAT